MYINMTPEVINEIAKNWEDPNKAAETQEMIEAIVAELKKDYRNYQRTHSYSEEAAQHWESLISDVPNRDYWEKLDHLLHFRFEY